ncbi:hypothetical protein D3C78_1204850 [compost metagenome]
MSWAPPSACGSRLFSRVGAKNAPSATLSPTNCASPRNSSSLLCSRASTREATSSNWACEASAPIFTPSLLGSPTTTLARRADRRSATASMRFCGTMMRRMAVHFCPALTVISRATSLTNRSNSSSSGVTSGARIAQFSESASAVNGTELRIRLGVTRSLAAVSAEPVKVTTSWPSRRSSRSPVLPMISCRLPAGSRPDSWRMRTAASVT